MLSRHDLLTLLALAIAVGLVRSQTSSCSVLNCQTCSSSTTCSTCIAGYFRASTVKCSACSLNCESCTVSTSCTTCSTGYYRHTIGKCYTCPTGCSVCYEDYTSSGKAICTSCLAGYTLKNTECTKWSLSVFGLIGIIFGATILISVIIIVPIVCCLKRKRVLGPSPQAAIMLANRRGFQPQYQPQADFAMVQPPPQSFRALGSSPYSPPQPPMFPVQSQPYGFTNQNSHRSQGLI